MNPSLNIVFAGTPAFTLPSLNALLGSKHRLQAVYTQPDRPAGRGRKLQPSAVKEWAQQQHLPILQPNHFKDPTTVECLAALQPDIMVVIAYGLILPKTILNIPRLGCINVHASLLPRWRGASPIQHAILHGDAESGVTIMQMDAGMDTGDMLAQVNCAILAQDTATSLHDRLAKLATTPLLQTLEALASGKAHPIVQDHSQATYAPKINKEQASIDWHQSAKNIDQQIRAFNPWPIAYTELDSLLIRIHQARVVTEPCNAAPGTIISINKHGILVATGESGGLLIERLQFPNANILSVADWVNSSRRQLETNRILGGSMRTSSHEK
jgi:methionyl-tRNA formyltransferase